MNRLSALLLKLRIMADRNMHYGGCQRRVRRPLGPVGGLVEKRGGLAEPGCRVAHVANAPVERELPNVPGDACRRGLADDPVAAEGESASGGDHAVSGTGFIVKLHSTSQSAQIAAAS